MKLCNDKAASAPGGYEWKGGDCVDVPDDEAAALLAIKDGGFYVSDPKHKVAPDPEPELAPSHPHEQPSDGTRDETFTADAKVKSK